MLISLAVSIFLLMASSSLVRAADNQSSPLFEESLQETVQEFNSGTRKIRTKLPVVQIRNSAGSGESSNTLGDDVNYEFENLLKGAKLGIPLVALGVIARNSASGGAGNSPVSTNPTFRGSTCIGILRCGSAPTLMGRTCSVTCGLRATCVNGWFCRQHHSPAVELEKPDRLAKGSGKPVAFTVF